MTITIPAAPLEDAELDAAFQSAVVGITGLDPTLVRPRWQIVSPKQPEPNINWCSIGAYTSTPDDGGPYIEHLNGPSVNDTSGDLLEEHEAIDVLVSFYGPNAKMYSGVFRSGLKLPANLETLKLQGFYYQSKEPERIAPELINQQWVRRWDTSMTFKRMVARVYGVPNVVSAEIDLFDDSGHVNAVINVPPSGR